MALLKKADQRRRVNNDDVILVPAVSCHILRHSLATRCSEAQCNISVLQRVMGHNDPATTLDIYVEAQEDFVAEEMSRLGLSAGGDSDDPEHYRLYQKMTSGLPETMKSYRELSELAAWTNG